MNALSPSRPDPLSYGLWSLWDMLEFNAAVFYRAVTALERAQGILESYQEKHGAQVLSEAITEKNKHNFILHMQDLDASLEILDCKVTGLLCGRIMERAANPKCTLNDIFGNVSEIRPRLADELTLHKLYCLESDKARYFEPDRPLFGDKFAVGYASDGLFELDEAGKCLALGRPTASVFHLMRLMEIGVRAAARCLSVPDPIRPAERNWGQILDKIWKGIEAKWPKTSDRLAGDGALFEAIYATLDAVKNPWRNATMHIENKYTDDEAEHIFVAVRGFMTKLASRCDENGEPKA